MNTIKQKYSYGGIAMRSISIEERAVNIAHYSTKVNKKNDFQPFYTKDYDFLTVKLPSLWD